MKFVKPYYWWLSIFLIVITTGVIAFYSAPNNWDSMTYHLSRVMHWIQNENVDHYSTNILRQLYQNPWAEYVILHLHILSGSDQFDNLVQWISMVGCLVGVSLVTKELGAGIKTQLYSAILSCTIPMGILQASSTQNDYVLSFWLVSFVLFTISIKKNRNELLNLFLAGSSLGLAILTKGSAYIYALPLGTWFLIRQIDIFRFTFWKPLSIIIFLSLLINFPHFLRNNDLFGFPLSPNKKVNIEQQYMNQIFNASAFFSNVIRNMCIHLNTSDLKTNYNLQKHIYKMHEWLGIDPNDPRTTWEGTKFYISNLVWHEDSTGNPVHLFIIILAIILLLGHKYLIKQKDISIIHKDVFQYFFVILGAFFLFNLILKWQPWHSRLQLPLFVLSIPFASLIISKCLNPKFISGLAILLSVLSIPSLAYNHSRPLASEYNIFNTKRIDQYFANHPDLKNPYMKTAKYLSLRQYDVIGLYLTEDDWEYPLWKSIRLYNDYKFKVEHINAEKNIIFFHKDKSFIPEAIIVSNQNMIVTNLILFNGLSYKLAISNSPLNVYVMK